MNEHEVVIIGGGPTGLMLAGELALAKVDVAIVERRQGQELTGLRAGGLHIRTLEVLDQRGIVDRFLAEGQVFRWAPFGGTTLDLSDLPTRHNYFLALWQTHFERILEEWLSEWKVPIYRGQEVTDFAREATGVDVEISGGKMLRAQYLVGCDGGRSLIRKKAGIEFPGWDATASWLIAEVEMADEPVWGIRRGANGINAIAKIDDGKRARVVMSEPRIGSGKDATIEDIREALIALHGTDYGLRSASYISRFTDMARQAASYREGRVLLAGDAAHVHSPAGGQGLNLGVQDAVNLGWKLAQVVKGISPESLLDTYHRERHPVGARVLRSTMALSAFERGGEGNEALRGMMCELIRMDQPRRKYLAAISGLDIHYDLGEGHPLLGRRMPDLDLMTADGPLRLFSLLRDGRPVLLNLGGLDGFDPGAWAGRVPLIDAQYDGAWELPVLGAVAAPAAVLVRPDGYAAWAGERGHTGLTEALTMWFGEANAK